MAVVYYENLSFDQKRQMYFIFIDELESFFGAGKVPQILTKDKVKRLDYIVGFINEYEREFKVIAK